MALHLNEGQSLASAAVDWLRQRPHLSASAVASYRGEVNRFAEHLASKGVRLVGDVSEQHWSDYLVRLLSDRTGVASRRKATLRQASALQAARITRSFLRHCWSRGWLGWLPGIENRRCLAPKGNRLQPIAPEVLRQVVLDTSAEDDERAARSRCAISLAFWGGLKPRELVALRHSHLVAPRQGQSAHLTVPGRSTVVECPRELVEQINRYDHIRRGALAHARVSDPPVLSRLRSWEPLSAHAAWHLLRVWPTGRQQSEPAPQRLGSRAVRDRFVALARSDADQALVDIARQTGRAIGALTPPARASATATCIEHVRAQLLDG